MILYSIKKCPYLWENKTTLSIYTFPSILRAGPGKSMPAQCVLKYRRIESQNKNEIMQLFNRIRIGEGELIGEFDTASDGD